MKTHLTFIFKYLIQATRKTPELQEVSGLQWGGGFFFLVSVGWHREWRHNWRSALFRGLTDQSFIFHVNTNAFSCCRQKSVVTCKLKCKHWGRSVLSLWNVKSLLYFQFNMVVDFPYKYVKIKMLMIVFSFKYLSEITHNWEIIMPLWNYFVKLELSF